MAFLESWRATCIPYSRIHIRIEVLSHPSWLARTNKNHFDSLIMFRVFGSPHVDVSCISWTMYSLSRSRWLGRVGLIFCHVAKQEEWWNRIQRSLRPDSGESNAPQRTVSTGLRPVVTIHELGKEMQALKRLIMF
jgi:hypothetical protein